MKTRGAVGETALWIGPMPRIEAQAATKARGASARETGGTHASVAEAWHPDMSFEDVFSLEIRLGSAPVEARAFVRAAIPGGKLI